MNVEEQKIIENINNVISTIKTISNADAALGSCMMFFLKQSLDLYECLAQRRKFNLKEIEQYVSNVSNYDPELTDFLMTASKEQYETTNKDLEVYQNKVDELRKLMQRK